MIHKFSACSLSCNSNSWISHSLIQPKMSTASNTNYNKFKNNITMILVSKMSVRISH